MNQSNPQSEKPQTEHRFDPELLKKGLRCDLDQYEMLKRCSDSKNITEWNNWRHNNTNNDVMLEGANLSSMHLNNSLFDTGEFTDFNGQVYLNNADFRDTYLNNVRFHNAQLKGANLWGAFLRKADMFYTHLECANLEDSYLEGTYFEFSYLQQVRFRAAVVDGFTLFWKCYVDHNTDFSEVALNNARINSEMKQLLEYNIRRKNWIEWYKEHSKLKWLVKFFWWASDYGLSTIRIMLVFFVLSFIFASIYYFFGRISPPGIVDNLFTDNNGIPVQGWLVPFRVLYFSIVTMTTLGFGDMYANAHSIWGHILLSLQVILGYVLLGALVTRFAVLFTAGGPAGKFADDKEKK